MAPYGSPPGAPQAPQTLESFLTQRGPLSAHDLSPLLGPVMDQLSSLHTGGQHHGNVSTDTITVASKPDGLVAGWLPEAAPIAAGALPHYQSPEQLAAGGQVGYWSDVYGMAAVLYRALTGMPPFPGGDAETVRLAHLGTPPPSLTAARPDLPPELDRVLQQGLAKAPADRQASMQAFRQAVDGAALAAPPPTAAYAPGAPAPGAPAPGAYAPTPGYGPGAPPPHLAAPSPGPPPPTVLHPSHQAPKKSSAAPMVVVAALVGVLAVGGAMVAFLFAAGDSKKDHASSSASSEMQAKPDKHPKPKPPEKKARPVKDNLGMGAASKGLALPGVDDKIKMPPPVAAGGTGPHYRLDITGRPWRGAADAPVVIALWSNLQCPWCKRTTKLLDDLLARFPKDLKVVWFDFPLRMHKGALPAAIAARVVHQRKGNRAFFRFTEKVYANQRNITPDQLARWAKEVGVDGAEITAALNAGKHKTAIEATKRYGQSIGVRGTPSLFINGIFYKGRRKVDAFSRMIKDELKRARAAIKAGKATRAGYYAHLMKSGLTRKPGGVDKKRPPSRTKGTLDPNAVYRVPVFADDAWRGAKRPLVTLVVWSDFECPYCRYLACSLEEVMRKYRRTVRLVFRHHPLSFHKMALPAAEALEAARSLKGNKGFWRMYAKVFPLKLCPRSTSKLRVREWLSKNRDRIPTLSRTLLDKYARRSRLPKRRFRAAMDSRRFKRRIEAQAKAVQSFGIRGTPALFVNGRYVRGYRSFAKLKVIIDAELKKARRLVKGGVSRKRLYNHIIRRGRLTLQYLP